MFSKHWQLRNVLRPKPITCWEWRKKNFSTSGNNFCLTSELVLFVSGTRSDSNKLKKKYIFLCWKSGKRVGQRRENNPKYRKKKMEHVVWKWIVRDSHRQTHAKIVVPSTMLFIICCKCKSQPRFFPECPILAAYVCASIIFCARWWHIDVERWLVGWNLLLCIRYLYLKGRNRDTHSR